MQSFFDFVSMFFCKEHISEKSSGINKEKLVLVVHFKFSFCFFSITFTVMDTGGTTSCHSCELNLEITTWHHPPPSPVLKVAHWCVPENLKNIQLYANALCHKEYFSTADILTCQRRKTFSGMIWDPGLHVEHNL